MLVQLDVRDIHTDANLSQSTDAAFDSCFTVWCSRTAKGKCLTFFLQVYKARWKGTLVAVKVLTSQDAAHRAEFAREIAMLEHLRHSHVVNYLGHIYGRDNQVMSNSRQHHICSLFLVEKEPLQAK